MPRESRLYAAVQTQDPAEVRKFVSTHENFENDENGHLLLSLVDSAGYDTLEIFQMILDKISLETLTNLDIVNGLANQRRYESLKLILDKRYDINSRDAGGVGKDLFTAVAEYTVDQTNDKNFLKFLIGTKKIRGLEGAVADLVIFGIDAGLIKPTEDLTFSAGEEVESGRLPRKFYAFFGNSERMEELLKSYFVGKTEEHIEEVEGALAQQKVNYPDPKAVRTVYVSPAAPADSVEGGGGALVTLILKREQEKEQLLGRLRHGVNQEP
jgi:hypothetical protein